MTMVHERPKVILRRGKAESLERRHPWIFSGAIERVTPETVLEGEVVDVFFADGSFAARGTIESGTIAIRVLTFLEEEQIDEAFWHRRIEAAYTMRRTLGLVECGSVYRLVHGEGDFLPGLIIDIYGEVAVLQAHTVGMHLHRQVITEALRAVYGTTLSAVYYKSDTSLPLNETEADKSGLLFGSFDESRPCSENGLLFIPDIIKGQKTGFFIDQRDNRMLLERYASGRRVLNLFCYTGFFSLYALKGGATEVVSVDSSSRAIDLAKQNVALNHFESSGTHESVVADAFKHLSSVEYGRYDLMVLDPPAFAKHRGAVKNALIGYRRLNAMAFDRIASSGIIFTFSCSQAISPTQFRQAIFTAALQAKRRVRILHLLTQPADHPVSIYHPEGEYLKGLVLYVE